jgi:hypothetical protein
MFIPKLGQWEVKSGRIDLYVCEGWLMQIFNQSCTSKESLQTAVGMYCYRILHFLIDFRVWLGLVPLNLAQVVYWPIVCFYAKTVTRAVIPGIVTRHIV